MGAPCPPEPPHHHPQSPHTPQSPLWPHGGCTATSQCKPSPLTPDSRWAPRWGCCHQKGSRGAHRGAPTGWYQWGHASSRCLRCPALAATRGAGPRVLLHHTATATLQGMRGSEGVSPTPHTTPCAQGYRDAPGGLHRDKGAKGGHGTNRGWGHGTVPWGLGDQGWHLGSLGV